MKTKILQLLGKKMNKIALLLKISFMFAIINNNVLIIYFFLFKKLKKNNIRQTLIIYIILIIFVYKINFFMGIGDWG